MSAGVKGLYFLGRYDYEVNASVVQETETGQEFGRDPRTGRQAISSADSVARVVAEPGRSLVIVEEQKLGRNGGVPPKSWTCCSASAAPWTFPLSRTVRLAVRASETRSSRCYRVRCR